MKAIVMAIVSLSVSAAMANSPAATEKTTTTTTTTTAPADPHHAHGGKGMKPAPTTAKTEDKCEGKTGKALETCKAEAKKAHQ